MAAPWVILRRFLGVVPKHAEAEHPAAISTALRAPPRVTILGVGPSARPGKVPYLVAAGPSGLLICFSVGEAPIETDDLIVAREFLAPADPSRQPTTGSAERIPRRPGSMPVTCNLRSLGLTPGLFPGDYVITELQVAKRSDRAKLLRFFSAERLWLDTNLFNPLSAVDADREWAPSGVVAHEGKLWFLDLSWGILSCDPSTILPVLRFHDLPPGRYIHEPKPFLHTIRCVSVSNHMLRYVDIARDLDLDGRVAERKVSVWTAIPDPDCGDSDHGIRWLKTYEMGFKEIWNDASYRETQLPAKIPEIVLVHPKHPNVVYFFLRRSLFGVDVPAHRVVGFVMDAHKLVAPGCRRCVLPWDLPASIANGLVEAIVPFQDQCGSSATTPGTSD
ncbi:hypothetical protein GQ55_4G247300 [Panicum hallii var. hallii]|uniref:DUF1618 domain-containing protein n=1 Tax=Panicum hallii var. hallii TaxID=1504633 RepID=A0A2T7DZX0_9POAL|nr:hypothetical protein GQ55_4G247300 [Panicum hallii var. hallii]